MYDHPLGVVFPPSPFGQGGKLHHIHFQQMRKKIRTAYLHGVTVIAHIQQGLLSLKEVNQILFLLNSFTDFHMASSSQVISGN